ncbi:MULTISPECIES: chemotaxis protein [unclassified Streptomyces]|uniref:baeRF3 domain-containing protein n=1 Tax=Streptomycetaceae TaxID=2062 RepID=UPI002E7937E8|nr:MULTISPECIES: chemotaxis protein [unclassified Streptomyces]MED7952935.1 chemotaxis protein [Streptomyces sp. BE303]MEE1821835.1 chemotaxis protein [Streptomyces sp. BE20]
MRSDLTTATLAELRRPRPYPAVSILMPTHRREPDNAQDPVLLRNLVAEARARIDEDQAISRADRLDVTGQLDQALKEVDLVHAEDGLALFVSPGEHQVWSLTRAVPARTVVSDSYLTRNLVAARAADRPYWVLALAADRISLWAGTGDRLEAQSGSFPFTRSLEDPDAERKERIGDLPSTFSDEATRQFFREAEAGLRDVLAEDPRPFHLVGEAHALSLFQDLWTATPGPVATVAVGGLAEGPAQALREAVRPALAQQADRAAANAEAELDQARGRQLLAAGLDEVWQTTGDGRIGRLVVEDDYRATVRDDGEHLVPATDGEAGAREDIVDEIIEKALDGGAQVDFVPDGKLSGMGHIAAVLRY